jgi:hypothetical protein
VIFVVAVAKWYCAMRREKGQEKNRVHGKLRFSCSLRVSLLVANRVKEVQITVASHFIVHVLPPATYKYHKYVCERNRS